MAAWYQTAIMSMVIGVLKMALPLITEELKKLISDSIKKWMAHAEETEYNWDNLVVKAIANLLGVELEAAPAPFADGPDVRVSSATGGSGPFSSPIC